MMARGILVFFLIAISVTSATAASSTTTSAPITLSTTTSAPITLSTKTSDPTTPSATTSDPTTLIPDTFYYNCTEDGVIKIWNKDNSFNNVDITYLNQSASGCANHTSDENGYISITGCGKSTPVNIVLEPKNNSEIIGGWHSKTFQIKCDTVNIQPYLIQVTASENIGKTFAPHVISMATEPTPSPISSLTMTIKEGNNTIKDAYIGQALTVAIEVPDGVNIKPVNCTASGNDKNVSLWQETGCIHDQELFGEKWTNASKEVTNTMYGFRFVGSSTSIRISCTVRVCPEGYTGDACDLAACGARKRKRMTKRSESVTLQTVTSSLAVRDPIMISRAGRQGCEINTIIGLSLFTLVFFKTKYFQG